MPESASSLGYSASYCHLRRVIPRFNFSLTALLFKKHCTASSFTKRACGRLLNSSIVIIIAVIEIIMVGPVARDLNWVECFSNKGYVCTSSLRHLPIIIIIINGGKCAIQDSHTLIIGQKQWGKLIKLHDSIYIGVWESWYPVPQYRRVPLLEQDTQPSLEVGDCLGLVLTGVPKGRSQFLHISLGRTVPAPLKV